MTKTPKSNDATHAETDGRDQGPASAAPTDSEPQSSSLVTPAPATSDPMSELKVKVDQLEEALLRAKADFQNLQRRSANERMEAVRYGNAELMRSLLGVLDDLERSLQAAESLENHQAVREGLRLVHANLLKALRGFGLEVIPALHERFDPLVHEALLQQPTSDFEPGTVMEEVAKGYRLRERVLRPARVIVAKAPEEAPQPAAARKGE